MIKVSAVCYVKEGSVDDFLAVAKELVEKTNTLDKGCIKYELCKDTSDPLHYVVLEEWESQSLLDEHMEAQHFIDLVPKLAELCSKDLELTVMEKVF
ncbi:MAG: antibiotic biosynthesis monooxygenase [Oscillospiraceae bacterium]|nr:antibiotic biosynthesis monooxygenase [Oscillospiraceae bacterium]